MTWGARIVRHDQLAEVATTHRPDPCGDCLHGQPDPQRHYNRPCHIPNVSSAVGTMLTSVDVGSDGHMASGEAILVCHGFEPMAEETTGDKIDAAAEEVGAQQAPASAQPAPAASGDAPQQQPESAGSAAPGS